MGQITQTVILKVFRAIACKRFEEIAISQTTCFKRNVCLHHASLKKSTADSTSFFQGACPHAGVRGDNKGIFPHLSYKAR